MTTNVDDFLAHHGVKGMRWGVHRDRSTSAAPRKKNTSGSSSGGVTRQEVRDGALKAGKVALKYGAAPAAVAIGASVGLPAVAALGVSVKVLQDPTVQAAASTAASYMKSVMPDMSAIKMVDIPKVNLGKLTDPLYLSSADRRRLAKLTADANKTTKEIKALDDSLKADRQRWRDELSDIVGTKSTTTSSVSVPSDADKYVWGRK